MSKIFSKNTLLHIISILFIAFSLYFLNLVTNISHYDNNGFKKNWNLYINDQKISSDYHLEDTFSKKLKKGDIIIIEKYADTKIFRNPLLKTSDIYATIEVFIDDYKVYSYGLEEYKNNKMLVDYGKLIKLPYNINNKKITIKMIVSENNSVSKVGNILLNEESQILRNYFNQEMISLILGCFLFIFGFILSIINIISHKNITKIMVYLSMFSVVSGIWVITKSGLLGLLMDNNSISKIIEYVSLFIAPISVLGIMKEIKTKDNSEPLFNIKTLNIFFIIFTVNVITCLILHLTNIAHFKELLLPFQGIILIFFICMIIVFLKNPKKLINNASFLFICLIIIIIGMSLNALSFNTKIYNISFLYKIIDNISIINLLFLILAFMKTYYDSAVTRINQAAIDETITRLAYSDILTGLHNRAWYEKYIETLNQNYTMISLDLNNLKTTNDTLGHDQGDTLIKTFGKIIEETFKCGNCIRFGGDEFLIIIETIDKDFIESLINEMNEKMVSYSKKLNLEINASYGIVYSDEFKNYSPSQLYKKADERMYKMKQNFHKND